MQVSQLDILQPKRKLQSINKLIEANRKQLSKLISKNKRAARAYFGSQYLVQSAVVDGRRAVRKNEDIILGCLIIILVLNFSAATVFANTLYLFMVSATILAELSGLSLLVLAMMALGVVGICISWLSMLMQNMLSIGIMHGLTAKRYKSLRNTVRISLAAAPRLVTAWLSVLLTASLPLAVTGLILGLAVYFGAINPEAFLPYLIGILSGATAWSLWLLGSLTLTPYIMLFDSKASTMAAFTASRHLVKRGSRLYLSSILAAFSLSLAGLYSLAGALNSATGIDASVFFLTFAVIPLSIANIALTLLYRKRKLARSF